MIATGELAQALPPMRSVLDLLAINIAAALIAAAIVAKWQRLQSGAPDSDASSIFGGLF